MFGAPRGAPTDLQGRDDASAAFWVAVARIAQLQTRNHGPHKRLLTRPTLAPAGVVIFCSAPGLVAAVGVLVPCPGRAMPFLPGFVGTGTPKSATSGTDEVNTEGGAH